MKEVRLKEDFAEDLTGEISAEDYNTIYKELESVIKIDNSLLFQNNKNRYVPFPSRK